MVRKRMSIRWEVSPAVTRACAGIAVDLGDTAGDAFGHVGALPPHRARSTQEFSP